MRFSDVLDIRNGRNQRQVENENGKYPIYGSGGVMGHADDFICDAETVVIGRKGSINNPIFVDEPFWNVDTAFGLVAHKEVLLPKYLYYFCVNFDFERLNTTVTIPSLTKANLLQIEIRVPDMDIQQNIVSVLDKICYLIELRQKELYNLDQLVKSRFIEMFGDVIRNSKAWQMRVFEDVAASRLGKMLDAKQQTGKYSYPYLANFNVQWFRFNIENLNQMDFDEDDRAEFELKDGDLLVCEGGEIGRCAVWHNEIQPCFFQKALHRVRCNRQIIHPDYLAWWFKYNCDYDGFTAIAGSKATIAHLPGIKLKQLQVAVPPIELQEQFATFVEQTDKSKYRQEKCIGFFQCLEKSIRQEWL